MSPLPVWRALVDAVREDRPACRVAIVEAPPELQALLGTRLALGPFGDTTAVAPPLVPPGDLPGGDRLGPLIPALEALAWRAQADGRPRLEPVGAGHPAGDPGPVLAFADPVLPPPHLVVAGGGHVAAALAPAALAAGFRVTVVDDRPEYARPDRFPGAAVVCGDMVQALEHLRPTPATFIVLAGRNHDLDRPLLKAALRRHVPYVGVLGSRRRVELLREQLLRTGDVTPTVLRHLRGPAGLDLGAETPAEIAVSIVAELLAVLRGGSGLPLTAAGERPQAAPGLPAGDREAQAVWLALGEAIDRGRPCALATVVRVRGSAPRGAGARMLVLQDEPPVGSVGGGRREAEVRRLAEESLRTARPVFHRAEYDDDREAACGGAAELFVEPVQPQGG